MFKCYNCKEKFRKYEDLIDHIEEDHSDDIPKDYSTDRYYFAQRTGKVNGSCTVCRNISEWNPKTNKYHRLCNNPKCKERYRAIFAKNMIDVHGKTTLLNDAEHQKKMLANRSISGEYVWSDGTKIPYTGTYEKDFLTFLDQFLEFESKDIMSPSPHTYYYEFEGKKRFYIPDFFIPSLNLEIEIKAGGNNENMHHKIQSVDRAKERNKDRVLMSQKVFSYIKVFDKKYESFFDLLMKMKEGTGEQLFYVEDWNKPVVVKESLLESAVDHARDVVMEVYSTMSTTKDVELLKEAHERLMEDEDIAFEQNHMRMILENRIKAYETDYAKMNSQVFNMTLDLNLETSHSVDELFGDNTIVSPGFIRNSFATAFEGYIRNGDSEIFRERIVEAWKDEHLGGTNVRDTYATILYLQQATGFTTNSDQLDQIYENMAWLTNVMEHSVRTKGGNRYPVYVLLTHTGTFLSNAIKKVTAKEFSHASIAFDPSLTDMYSFGRKYKNNPLIGRFAKEDINTGLYEMVKEKASYALYVTFVTEDEYNAMTNKLIQFQDRVEELKYNFTGLFKFKMGKETHRDNAFFCSQFVDTILASGRNYFDRHSSLVAPMDFADHPDFYYVTSGVLSEYDVNFVKKKVSLIAASVDNHTKEAPLVAYVPLTSEDIKKKELLLGGDIGGGKLSIPTSLKAMVNNNTGGVYSHYTVVPLMRLGNYQVVNNNILIDRPTQIDITNTNKL